MAVEQFAPKFFHRTNPMTLSHAFFKVVKNAARRAIRIAEVNDGLSARIADLPEESRAADKRLAERIDETDKRLGCRIEYMISRTKPASRPKTSPPR
jgi:hypothetical protein